MWRDVTPIRSTRGRSCPRLHGVAGTGKGVTPRQRAFGDRVRHRREGLGLSQEALALRSGLHRTYIGSLEAGDRNPSLDLIARLALGLGCDVADLVHGLQDLVGRSPAGEARPGQVR